MTSRACRDIRRLARSRPRIGVIPSSVPLIKRLRGLLGIRSLSFGCLERIRPSFFDRELGPYVCLVPICDSIATLMSERACRSR